MQDQSTGQGIPPQSEFEPQQASAKSRAILLISAVVTILLLVGIGFAVVSMVNHPDRTENIRDIVIIFMAVESLVIGTALIILIIQLAQLTALLQNEIKPILDSTNETVDTLRGTTAFLSDRLVDPAIKLNSSLAAVRRAIDLIRSGRSQ
jgi:hypothetical protein